MKDPGSSKFVFNALELFVIL